MGGEGFEVHYYSPKTHSIFRNSLVVNKTKQNIKLKKKHPRFSHIQIYILQQQQQIIRLKKQNQRTKKNSTCTVQAVQAIVLPDSQYALYYNISTRWSIEAKALIRKQRETEKRKEKPDQARGAPFDEAGGESVVEVGGVVVRKQSMYVEIWMRCRHHQSHFLSRLRSPISRKTESFSPFLEKRTRGERALPKCPGSFSAIKEIRYSKARSVDYICGESTKEAWFVDDTYFTSPHE